MSQANLRQRLVSILAADVAGYSRLMGSDERATVAALEAARAVFRSEIEAHQGRVVDMVGDSVLALFESAAGAVTAAIAVQEALRVGEAGTPEERRMRFRIGVHLGDVFEKPDGTIYGDGVNIASRLEGLAEAGGIAVSGAVEGAVRGKIPRALEHRGTQRVKNILGPVDWYRVVLPGGNGVAQRRRWSPRVAYATVAVAILVLLGAAAGMFWHAGGLPVGAHGPPARPPVRSVAVLPFVDLSEGGNQSFFSDGLSEEVIGRLTRIPQLRVIARTSSFAFKGSPASAADIGRQLNVANLLEGSVRRSADRVRVTAQLVQASDSTNLWSATYERKLTDVFAMQDEIANAVVAALQVSMEHGAQSGDPSLHVPAPDAYDEYLRGRQLLRTRPDDYEKRAVEAFSRAVALDDRYAAAHSALAFALSFIAENELDPAARRPMMERAYAAAEEAVALGPGESDAFATRGYLRFEFRKDVAGADEDFQKAMQLDPNAGATLTKYSDFLSDVGRSDEALALVQRIKATDPFFAPPWEIESRIQAARGNYHAAEDALRHARSILQLDPEGGMALAVLALLKGEPQRALKMAETVRDPAHRAWVCALAEHDLGDEFRAGRALADFVAKSPYEYYQLAAAHARADNLDAAFAALDSARLTQDPDLDYVLIDPLLANLREDPRYEVLLKRLGLPDPRSRQGVTRGPQTVAHLTGGD